MKQVMSRFIAVWFCAAVSLPNLVALAKEEKGDQRGEVEKVATEMQALKSIIKRQGETITQLKQENENLAIKVQELQTALDKAKAQARAWETVKPDSHEWRQLFAWEGGMGVTEHNFVMPDTVKDWRVRWRSKPKIEGASRTFIVYIRKLLGEYSRPIVASFSTLEQKEYEEGVFYCEGTGNYELEARGMGAQQWEVVVEGRMEKTEEDVSAGTSPEEPERAETDKLGIWDGFRDIKWGTELAQVPEMKVENRPTSYQTNYERPKDKKIIGDAKLEKIRYSAINGKLGVVGLETKGLENNLNLMKSLSTVFGNASDKTIRGIWEWHGETTWGENVTIWFFYNYKTEITSVQIVYEPLRKEEEKEAAKELHKDF